MKKSLGILMSILMLVPTQSYAEESESLDSLLAKSTELRLELVELTKSKAKEKRLNTKQVSADIGESSGDYIPDTEISKIEMDENDEKVEQIIDFVQQPDEEDVNPIICEPKKLNFEIENINSIDIQGLGVAEIDGFSSDCVVFEYKSDVVETVYVRPGFVTDISLGLGESLERITLGNSTLFEVNTYLNSNSDGAWHVYINPIQKNVETNMIVVSDRRVYQVKLIAGDLFFPFVKWNIKDDIRSLSQGQKLQNKNGLNLGVKDISDLHSSYAISAKSKFRWAPTNVFDDKYWNTYFYFESGKLDSINPMIFTENSDGILVVVPYEKAGDILVIKGINSNLVMKYGSDIIKFHRK